MRIGTWSGCTAHFAVVAESVRSAAVLTEQLLLADLEEWPVYHLDPARPPGQEDLGEDVVEVIAGVVIDLDPAGQHRHLDRGREICWTEDDRLQSRGRVTDLLDVEESPGRLDLNFYARAADRQSAVLLHLGEQEIERDNLVGGLSLWQHDLVESRTGVPQDLDHVAVGPGRPPPVQADAKHPIVPVKLAMVSTTFVLADSFSDAATESSRSRMTMSAGMLGAFSKKRSLDPGTERQERTRQAARAVGHDRDGTASSPAT